MLLWVFVVIPLLLVYPFIYFNSKKFLDLKNSILSYVRDCNDLNDYIFQLYNKYRNLNLSNNINIGTSSFTDSSVYNFKRPYLNKITNNSYNIYNCSLHICKSANNQPFKYLLKYFNIPVEESTVVTLEAMLNDYLSVNQGKQLIIQKKQQILNDIRGNIPFIIKTFYKTKLDKKLGFHNYSFVGLTYPSYVFRYVSDGGYASTECKIELNCENIESLIQYIVDQIRYRQTAAFQRSLMTARLREQIKARDGYRCKNCGVSINDEPHLLLEVDHIIPVARGGKTEESNLQTLCWKCNRSKGTKLKSGEDYENCLLGEEIHINNEIIDVKDSSMEDLLDSSDSFGDSFGDSLIELNDLEKDKEVVHNIEECLEDANYVNADEYLESENNINVDEEVNYIDNEINEVSDSIKGDISDLSDSLDGLKDLLEELNDLEEDKEYGNPYFKDDLNYIKDLMRDEFILIGGSLGSLFLSLRNLKLLLNYLELLRNNSGDIKLWQNYLLITFELKDLVHNILTEVYKVFESLSISLKEIKGFKNEVEIVCNILDSLKLLLIYLDEKGDVSVLSEHLMTYEKIVTDYFNDIYYNEHLSIQSILRMANEDNLLDKLTPDDLTYLLIQTVDIKLRSVYADLLAKYKAK